MNEDSVIYPGGMLGQLAIALEIIIAGPGRAPSFAAIGGEMAADNILVYF